jgi:uncharacterized protein (DUF952 family)
MHKGFADLSLTTWVRRLTAAFHYNQRQAVHLINIDDKPIDNMGPAAIEEDPKLC